MNADLRRQARSTALISALMAEQTGARRFRYGGPIAGGSRYLVEIGGRRRGYDIAAMEAWLDWFNIGSATAKARPRRLTPLNEVRAVLVAPTLADALRTEIRYRMEVANIGRDRLAELAGKSTKAVTDALKYGTPGGLSVPMVVALAGVLECDIAAWLAQRYADVTVADVWHSAGWDTRYVRRVDTGEPIPPLSAAPHEPAPLARVRALAIFHERRLIHWESPVEVNKALRAGAFLVARGSRRPRVIRAEVLYPALTGLADAVDSEALELLQR